MNPEYCRNNVMSKMLGPKSTEIIGPIQRQHFGTDFIFGSATAAFQDDVKLMKNIGMEAYRFSISWPRILPGGRINAGINREGIKFYSDLIDLLLAQGIEPYVTLFHFDLPLALELEYGGFLSNKIVKDFTEFAELCFREFGDRVKNWITFNEGWTYCNYGYVAGTFPPGHGLSSDEQRNSKYRCCGYKGAGIQQVCSKGDAGTEPYQAAHNMLLAHAHAVNVYRKLFQKNQGGKIGITNNSHFFEPLNDTDEDRDACIRALDWMLGWFVAPVTTGDYPPNMRKSVKERLPLFSPVETNMIKGSYDFLGLNYYTTWYATNAPKLPSEKSTYLSDQELTTQTEKNGVSIGDPTDATWLFIVPRGIYNLLVYVKETYNTDLIYITENGMAEVNNSNLTISKARMDPQLVRYYNEHLSYLRKAIMEGGVNVKAYFLWSFADNFEWAEGYTSRFVTTGDYPPNMRKSVKERLPKFSPEETKLIKDSYDFIGLNYYTTWYATNAPRQPGEKPTYLSDQEFTTQTEKNGVPIGEPTGATWLFIVPRGIYNLLVYVKETYNTDLIYITENGMVEVNNPNLTISKARMDPQRVRYYNQHLWYLRKAIMEADVNVKAYFLWSFADNFEWAEGYTSRFGIFYIDFKDGRYTRVPKTSVIWWKNFFTQKSIRGSLKREGHGCDLEKKPKGYGSDLEKKPKVMNGKHLLPIPMVIVFQSVMLWLGLTLNEIKAGIQQGMAEANNPNLTISKARMDPLRVRYYNEHLWEADVNVMAYFLWSFADNFEWAEGYTSRFGIFYIDFKDLRYTRVPKTSAKWWKNFFTKKSIKGSLKREATEIGHGCDLEKKLIGYGSDLEKKPKVMNG
ncbi:hypothetical protein RD792_005817 [Penstemon davidsonii]|uniref:Uncharacterized protein n=1 Tax=Penstemon davidsonii TaxID=160366 RepID=A0ABR0DE98_9LAMI|nr:hypothetical protein RD792_005817 [Penstemon davidsonii]